MKPKKAIILEEVPIDALRGLYFLLHDHADKKLSKIELKRNLHELLSVKEKQDKLVQHIVDIVFTEEK